MRIHSVVGVRPEFVMAAPVLRELEARDHASSLIHTGQHHDEELSATFFAELPLPPPDHHLGVGSAPRSEQVARIVERLAPILTAESPTAVAVYGDTTSTIGGALAAAATDTPLVHVEAGLRSGDWQMPEERNRIIVDHMADLRLAPTADAVDALAAEGVTRGVRRVGDVRADAVALSQTIDSESKGEATGPDLPDSYALATVHRQATTDDESTLRDVIDGLERASLPVVLPIHPRTADRLGESGMIDWAEDRVRIVEPLGHTAFLGALDGAAAVATDSGGVQREASYLGTPCVTLRETTEWRGTVDRGENVLVGTDPATIAAAIDDAAASPANGGNLPGHAADGVVTAIERWQDSKVVKEVPR
jgi:UDP-N-acetylglucosamine 2-epimerase (non-hydrolysing)